MKIRLHSNKKIIGKINIIWYNNLYTKQNIYFNLSLTKLKNVYFIKRIKK